MNILIIPSWYPQKKEDIGGSFFREQALALVKDGHHVTVLDACLLGRGSFFNKNRNKLRIYEDNGIKVYAKNVCSFGRARFETWGLKIYKKSVKRVLQAILRDGLTFDIIHAHSFWCGGIASIDVSKILGIPFVITEHMSSVLNGDISANKRELMRQVYQASAKMIVVSNALGEAVSSICNDQSDKIVTVPNMVDCNHFVETAKNEKFTFVTVSYLNHNKRQDLNISAFLKAFAGNENVQFFVIGDGEQRIYLEKLVDTNNARNKVHFLGQKSRSEVFEILNKAHVFSLPSEFETFGVAYIEALSCGLPIIGVKNGGANDIINENNGLIVEKNDLQQLTQAFKSIYDNYEKYNKTIVRNDCKERFSESSVSKQLATIYAEVVNSCK